MLIPIITTNNDKDHDNDDSNDNGNDDGGDEAQKRTKDGESWNQKLGRGMGWVHR